MVRDTASDVAEPPYVIQALDGRNRAYAEQVARARQRDAGHRPNCHGATGGLDLHILGALGEVAFGVWLYGGRPFRVTHNTFRSRPDFPRTEVKARSRPQYELIIRRDDELRHAYVLVVPFGSGPATFRLVGWSWGWEVRKEWLQTHGGREESWFVPQAALHPMSLYSHVVHSQQHERMNYE